MKCIVERFYFKILVNKNIKINKNIEMDRFAPYTAAMKTIKNNFTKNEDYKVTLFHTEKRKRLKTNRGCHKLIIIPREKNKFCKYLTVF